MIQRPIPILMYHQIDARPPKKSPMRGLIVAPKSFARQMAVMRALGYRGLSMKELQPYLMGLKQGKVFGITFDDGYENNITHALPILKKYGFSSTCYVVAERIGQTNSWDVERGVTQVPLMTSEQLKAWRNAGQEIGSHTLTHPNLAQLSSEQQKREITDSRNKLQDLLSQQDGVENFCYPYGGLNDAAVQHVIAAGYSTATTTVRGRVVPKNDLNMFLLPRVLVSRTTTWLQLLIKCFTRYEDKRGLKMANIIYK